MSTPRRIIVALSGGVDSAVAAALLKQGGHTVECLHMSNWEDDGYCDNAREFQHARQVCEMLDLPLHRVSFVEEYRASVFADFLTELRHGRTPNPDVLCNKEIKFGVLRDYARRLGSDWLATGHYARLAVTPAGPALLKGRDVNKDQSYFLHAVDRDDFTNVMFPLGELEKREVRRLAREVGLSAVADKKDSTGICFIGERPFAEFLSSYLPEDPGPIVTADGREIGRHCGLAFYTLGQRHGLEIGGLRDFGSAPWYVAAKRNDDNALVVVQGGHHRALYSRRLQAAGANWLCDEAAQAASAGGLRCMAKTRYRQADQPAAVCMADAGHLCVQFEKPQRAVTPGQFVVFYAGDRCLGGAVIESVATEAGTAGGSENASRVGEASLI
ncbi:MAG: tRNA 2-thiouridine(34) synthase MnmA [Gammaproteobacteria bacterium]|jgi:tRNA-specific 2-thiouridylase